MRLLYRARFKDYAVCDTKTGRASDLVGANGEEGRRHQVHNRKASGTPGVFVDDVTSNGRWLVLDTVVSSSSSSRPTVYTAAWDVSAGTVRTIAASLPRATSLDQRYLLSDGTVVFSLSGSTPPSSGIYYDPLGKPERVVLDVGNNPTEPRPDASSLAVSESQTGATAYWKKDNTIFTAEIPRASG